MVLEYTEKVIEHFRNPRNLGELEDRNAEATEGSPACGDMLTIHLKIESNIIKDIKFKSYGCASNIATASMVTELVKGKDLEFAKNLTWQQVMKELGGLPKVKIHCSVLSIDTLKSAVYNYEKDRKNKVSRNKKDILSDKKVIKNKILEGLNKVVHPKYGDTLNNLKLIKYIGYDNENKFWLVEIVLDKDSEFFENIDEEIKEKIDKLKKEDNINIKVDYIDYSYRGFNEKNKDNKIVN